MRAGYDKATGQPVAYDVCGRPHTVRDMIRTIIKLGQVLTACQWRDDERGARIYQQQIEERRIVLRLLEAMAW